MNSEHDGRAVTLDSVQRQLLTPRMGKELSDVYFLTEREIARHNDRPAWRSPRKHDLLIFATAPNGDAWALDLLTEPPSVGLISHDKVWEGRATPRDGFVRVTSDLDTMIRAAEANTLPVDYWEAIDGGE